MEVNFKAHTFVNNALKISNSSIFHSQKLKQPKQNHLAALPDLMKHPEMRRTISITEKDGITERLLRL